MKDNSFYLSVIIPVYNAEKYLSECIESILNQTYKKFELILVDDGSTDKSGKICDEYAEKNVNVSVLHIKNSGPFEARKRGVLASKGAVVTFSDADDRMEVNAFEKLKGIYDNFEPDIIAYAYELKGIVEKNIYEEGLYIASDIYNEIMQGMMYDPEQGQRRLNPSLCCKWIKKVLFLQAAERVTDRITFGDDALVTYPAVCMADSIYICNLALYHYRENTESCTHTYPLERINEVISFQKNILQIYKKLNLLEYMEFQVEQYIRYFFSMMIKNWYNISLSSINYIFPHDKIPFGSNIIIYGAGIVGKSYINDIRIRKYVKIVGWVDKKYDSLKRYNGVEINPPESILEKKFDFILIGIVDEKIADIIKKELYELGVPKEKIVWEKPIGCM